MERIKRMALFATVVDKGSMVAAAEVLGMTPSAVSQQIRKLEQSTQVSLLHRTTRKLTLTEAGASFYQNCAQILALAQQAEQRLAELRDAPVGELRIAAPVGFSGRLLTDALAPLLRAHPGLKLRLFFHDEQIDLIEQRIDLAIRVGPQEDSSLVARHLGDWPMLLCVAPSYLARCGLVTSPEQLSGLDWLSLQGHWPEPGQSARAGWPGAAPASRQSGGLQQYSLGAPVHPGRYGHFPAATARNSGRAGQRPIAGAAAGLATIAGGHLYRHPASRCAAGQGALRH